uniref:Uncharacterized protein n=1 Tax=Anguilla anguilla TaxID=7936 RepID=A0A0E9SD17_ANGAN
MGLYGFPPVQPFSFKHSVTLS